ncbi:MAG: pyridoxamine 5'-phosphate oxidase family protein [Chloroflexota bacterium]
MSDVETLRDQIKDIKIAMLTTVDQDGTLRSRPMGTQDVEFDGDLWFFTADPSGKADEVRHQQQVNVSYADPGKSSYVSVSGRAMLVHDKAKMEEYWNPIYKIWFHEGLETPDIALLRVTVEKAEYWEASGNKLVRLVNFVKAIATGDESVGSKNEKLTLR